MQWGWVVGLLVVACATPREQPRPSPAPSSPPIAPSSSASPPEPRSTLTLRCQDVIDAIDLPPPNYASVLDAVALPKDTLQANPRDVEKFAKSGLVVRRDTESELEVGEGSRLRIGWGGGEPAERVVIPACPGPKEWIVFAGGFYVPDGRCEVVTVRAGKREVGVSIGIGRACD